MCSLSNFAEVDDLERPLTVKTYIHLSVTKKNFLRAQRSAHVSFTNLHVTGSGR